MKPETEFQLAVIVARAEQADTIECETAKTCCRAVCQWCRIGAGVCYEREFWIVHGEFDGPQEQCVAVEIRRRFGLDTEDVSEKEEDK